MPTQSIKATLRQELSQRRDNIPTRQEYSDAICRRIIELPLFQTARVIHCYLPIRSEVDTRPLITYALEHDKGIVVPIVETNQEQLAHSWLTSLADTDLVRGLFGTLKPMLLRRVNPGNWDLTIVPLLGFDRDGYRLGYGKGYYDRLLANITTPTIGVGFTNQGIVNIPHDAHDIRLDWVVTEDETLEIIELKLRPTM